MEYLQQKTAHQTNGHHIEPIYLFTLFHPFPFFHSFPYFFSFPLREKLLIILLVSDIPNHDGIFSQKQTRWLLSIWIPFSFFSYLFHLEILDNYSASTWHQQNWWNICNKKHHTRPMATTSNQSICLPFSILFHSFPFFFTFPLREKMLIILLVPDINKTGGIFATKNATPDQWPPHWTTVFVYPFPSFSIFSILFHTCSPFL